MMRMGLTFLVFTKMEQGLILRGLTLMGGMKITGTKTIFTKTRLQNFLKV